MNAKHRFNIAYAAIVIVLIVIVQAWIASRDVATLSYSGLMHDLDAGRIAAVTITPSSVRGRFREPVDGRTAFVAERVDPAIADTFSRRGVEVTGGADGNWLTTLLSWVVPTLFFFAVWMFAFRNIAERQGLGGVVNIGKSKAKVFVERDTGVTFDDVAGIDEAKAELKEVVSFLKDKETYGRLGARVPKGILLVGPPGTGKTLMARAVAGEAGVPFFSISGAEFVEMFVGVGAARVRDLFDQARKAAPCIIFIDELDALGRARLPIGGFGNDEKEQTLNQLLAELDGFDPRAGIVLLAATNRPEVLDPALLRAGRFDRQVVVDRPERKGRAAILAVHAKGIRLDPAVSLDAVAALTPGFSGADLANLVNEAAIVATRRGAGGVSMEDFTIAVERIVAGAERRSRLLTPAERRRVACHEMGHALVAAAVPGADPVHKVSIIPRTIGALGYTMQRPTEDRFLITFDELKGRMTVLMAGRAAEELVFGEISTGAADDLAKATDIARQCVTRFGMSETVGQAVLEEQRMQWLGDTPGLAPRQKDFAEDTAREVDLAVRALLDEAYRAARERLKAARADLLAGTDLLLAHETVTPDDFPPLRRPPPRAEAA